MAAPDLSDLNPLLLYDATPSSLVERAVLDAAVKMPDWVPLAGQTEMVLIEAMALEVAELVYAINRLPDGVIDVLLRLFGVTRSLGTAPTVTVTFTLSSTTGTTIPAGTVVRLDLGAGVFVDFETDVAVSSGTGDTTVDATATALTSTSAANGTASGTPVELVSPVPFIDSVALGTDVAAGSDPEDSNAWRQRALATFQRLTTTLVLPEHFTAAAMATPGVARATTVDNWNVSASAAGHVTVAVIGAGGAALSGPAKTALQADLEAQCMANLAVHVIDATITDVDVTTEVQALPGYDLATVTANIQAVLEAYLSPDAWAWGGTVRHNELIARIDGAEGVDYVSALTAPAGDAALSGVGPLANLGTLTVTLL
jgi:uncharacterized phage protein gp47/JayE